MIEYVENIYAKSKCTVALNRSNNITEFLSYVDRVCYFLFLYFLFISFMYIFFCYILFCCVFNDFISRAST